MTCAHGVQTEIYVDSSLRDPRELGDVEHGDVLVALEDCVYFTDDQIKDHNSAFSERPPKRVLVLSPHGVGYVDECMVIALIEKKRKKNAGEKINKGRTPIKF